MLYLLFCNELNIIYSKELSLSFIPLIDLKGKIFMFKLTNNYTVIDHSYAEAVPYLVIENNGKPESTKLKKGKCEHFPQLEKLSTEDYECLDQDQNLTIYFNRSEGMQAPPFNAGCPPFMRH